MNSYRNRRIMDGVKFEPQTSDSQNHHPYSGTRAVSMSQNDVANVRSDEPIYLKGEHLKDKTEDVIYLDPFMQDFIIKGTLCITSYRLYFISDDPRVVVDVPLGYISRVENLGGVSSKTDNFYRIEIISKDMRNLRFAFPRENHSRRQVFNKILQFAFPLYKNQNLFAFDFEEIYQENGWEVYNALEEWKRQGVPNDSWRITKINENYELCDTYPDVLAVPSAVNDAALKCIRDFRKRALAVPSAVNSADICEKGRIPVLSWIHPDNRATITHSGELGSPRSSEDEWYITAIKEANAQGSDVCIFDSLVSVELPHHRQSLMKLKNMCFPTINNERWTNSLQETGGWLHIISAALGGAGCIARMVENKQSVLVNCKHDLERSALMTSLPMLMLDPYYRTIKGFEVLIEKEWVSYAHRFSLPNHNRPSETDRSPFFLEFIDCTWQMTQQFPEAFEFNENFLITILDHVHSCLFGTFLYDSEMQRVKEGVKTHTHSLWSYTNSQLEKFPNPNYRAGIHSGALLPEADIRKMQLWTGYYLRWNPDVKLEKQKS